MKTLGLSILLSLNAGFVDTAGFLALHALFTAHVTGNFVTFGAAIANGSSGAIAKLLALPVFCAVIILVQLLSYRLPKMGLRVPDTLLALQLLLLAIGAAMMIGLGPFSDGDSPLAIASGMVLVSAMAIQNTLNRVHFSSIPPSTLMTGNTTQIMVDLADLLHGLAPTAAAPVRGRLKKMATSVVSFAFGCGAASLAYIFLREWCFVFPPLIALAALVSYMTGPKALTTN
jgi:uncharacterized membrane protein YoaK (UPF0700 family)